jgi:hypothetical protein
VILGRGEIRTHEPREGRRFSSRLIKAFVRIVHSRKRKITRPFENTSIALILAFSGPMQLKCNRALLKAISVVDVDADRREEQQHDLKNAITARRGSPRVSSRTRPQ